MWRRKDKKCDCGEAECKRKIIVINGRLRQEYIFTCGHFKKQIEKLKKIIL